MKIDIHVHTKKIKSGDAPTRNIDKEKFADILKNTNVKILAITNHNHFDSKQFEEFRDEVSKHCQVWPGIEFDINENGKKSHLIVICNPGNYKEFDQRVQEIINSNNPDTFTISVNEIAANFDDLDCIYIAHYFKKPYLGEEEIQKLCDLISNSKRILKEASNSISAGIYISHGHNSIYGSDVQDWDKYIETSQSLPELRLPVESFDQFCLLLEKDEPTINTILSKKVKENIEIVPFTAAEIIRLDVYPDINVLFGSKGTGKTEILEALSRYFNAKGHKTSVYKSNDNHLNDVYDIKGNSFNCNASDFGIDDCIEDIIFLKEVVEEDVTSLNKYFLHYSFQETNKISQKLKIRYIDEEDETQSKRILDEINEIRTEFKSFTEYIEDNEEISHHIDSDLISELSIYWKKY